MKRFPILALAAMAIFLFACTKENIATLRVEESLAQELKNPRATIWTKTVQLSPENEIAEVMTTAYGVAIFRLTADYTLHYRINVDDLPEDDMLIAAHIHAGTSTVNGPVKIWLARSPADFGINKTVQLTEEEFQMLMNDALYVNVHSIKYPAGLIRGQIRD